MDLRLVNQFTPLPLLCHPFPRPETGLVGNTVFWLSEQFNLSKLSLGLLAKFCLDEYSGAVKGFCTGSVCYACVAGSPFMYCLGIEIYFLYHEARTKYLEFFVTIFMIYFHFLLDSKSCRKLELCYTYLHYPRVSTDGVHFIYNFSISIIIFFIS